MHDHVLLVENDIDLQEMERIRLRRMGFDITVQDSVDEGLQALQDDAESYRVVITEHRMPCKSGLQLAEALRERGYEVPVVLLTAYPEEVSAEEGRAAGIDAVLDKPVSMKDLKAVLDDLL